MDETVSTERKTQHTRPDPRACCLPLVSIIVINFNYGHFLRAAVTSVFEQSYDNKQCIVVDNASTDDSHLVLDELSRLYPELTIVRRSTNGGLCVAAIDGFEASKGQYVVFLDADDLLLPRFIETHIFVQLSLRVPVGATSSDMIQAVGSSAVVGTCFSQSGFMRSEKGKVPGLLRRIDDVAPELWNLSRSDASLADQVRLVDPLNADWVWSPTSGNCFRRDALALFLNERGVRDLFGCLDNYLLRGISVLTGSVLIDLPLSVYRHHGKNIFSKHPHLNGIMSYQRGGEQDFDLKVREYLIDYLIENANLFLARLPSFDYFFDALEALNDVWPRLRSSKKEHQSYLAEKLAAEFDALVAVLDANKLSLWPTGLGRQSWFRRSNGPSHILEMRIQKHAKKKVT